MTRRRAAIAGLVLVALAWRFRPADAPSPEPVASASVAATPPSREAPRAPPAAELAAVEPAPVPDRFAPRVREVAEACDLSVEPHCEGARCVAIVPARDLDRFRGWLSMAVDSPGFVLGIIARDLGLPDAASSCAGAIGALGGQVLSLDLADGNELWCTADGPFDATTRRLCHEAGRDRVGAEAARFEDPGTRRLSFR